MSDRQQAPLKEKRRLGNWMPAQERTAAAFRRRIAAAAAAAHDARRAPLAGVVRDLADLVHGDAVLRMNLTRAIDEARAAGYDLGYASIDELMRIVDYLMTYAPPFSASAPVATPLNVVLDWPMCMPSGYAVFRDPAFNAQLRRVLDYWCGFLSGPHSRAHLNGHAPDGWFCEEAREKMGLEEFVCDPSQPHWGFESWNAFFTRRFRPGARPVAGPDDHRVIVSACEASPYDVRENVKLHDRFWIKSQPYSLREILTASQQDLAERFVGGSIFQGYLSAFNYHRWHAPVAGRIRAAYNVDGTCYSDVEAEGVDPRGLNDSQGYMTAVAARAVVVIDCDDPGIGEVACVFVGMAEVSSCTIVALPGQRVAKGDELGCFQYGGSTYCLIFRPGVIERFVPQPPYRDDVPPLRVNSHLATARG
ncbi:phosphatidylserine decarboxylase family protein [Paraburkholderia caballeronis]|uniref:Phosphatidylserine decarboxylase n=1 Tax=Paraburkholderia caballeronis TaxID=416943 RepID=A0A1H7MY91_9BURK|nr:phosphatidylserine decarboxylase family protein [Paraburkholderia caballeronis]PXW26355.1 phosphatidylserine decarboxylase [Paraburkholderia caballeronis]PXX01902.1 phosphatidylserine decarboxylase [Paraburkholderia caballeronis]RAK01059.1 phosphatidylserine decarboxylase [Paraburkholderia caballeronis]SEC00367.1 phosphatidylserine decarboxylase [Paraburkholderia caballeronis]SEL16173.1 phosphatidylserine decarboxylase [Paraburkholderia caballeronis]